MSGKLQLVLEVDQDQFFRNWDKKILEQFPEEEKQRIIAWFINRNLALKRDNYQCQNEKCPYHINNLIIPKRRNLVTVHHIIPRRDFKENPESMVKRLGYGCDDLQNLITLCKKCHVNYEGGNYKIIINKTSYKLEKPSSFNMKKIIIEGKKLRQELKKIGKVGWYGINEEERIRVIYLLMRWLTREWTELAETFDD